jgi:prophage regulatory protein
MRVLSYGELRPFKGIRFSRQWIVKLVAAGKFPKPISLGEQSVGFIESEIDAWIDARIRERDQKRAAVRPAPSPVVEASPLPRKRGRRRKEQSADDAASNSVAAGSR